MWYICINEIIDWYFCLFFCLFVYWDVELSVCFIIIVLLLCVFFVDCRVYGILVELDGEDDDLEGE